MPEPKQDRGLLYSTRVRLDIQVKGVRPKECALHAVYAGLIGTSLRSTSCFCRETRKPLLEGRFRVFGAHEMGPSSDVSRHFRLAAALGKHLEIVLTAAEV